MSHAVLLGIIVSLDLLDPIDPIDSIGSLRRGRGASSPLRPARTCSTCSTRTRCLGPLDLLNVLDSPSAWTYSHAWNCST